MMKKTSDGAELARSTLDATYGRASTFLRGVGTTEAIRSRLATRGYDQREHDRGWTLLHAAAGYQLRGDGAKTPAVDAGVAQAIAELDAWDEPNLRIVRAALTRLHPEAAAFVLDGIEPATGVSAVLGVKALLDRLDALQKAPERKATREEDKAALETLARRGIDANERARLRALVARAEDYIGLDQGGESKAARQERDAKNTQALKDLRAWYEDWAEMARVLITRRDHLIRLGLAKRKMKSAAKPAAKPAPTPDKPASTPDKPAPAAPTAG